MMMMMMMMMLMAWHRGHQQRAGGHQEGDGPDQRVALAQGGPEQAAGADHQPDVRARRPARGPAGAEPAADQGGPDQEEVERLLAAPDRQQALPVLPVHRHGGARRARQAQAVELGALREEARAAAAGDKGNKAFALKLVVSGRDIALLLDNEFERDEWHTAIQSAIDANS